MKSLLLSFVVLLTATLAAAGDAPTKRLPRLVDLGADNCIPCKLMTPVLSDLTKDYAGQLNVVFIDVWKKPDDGKAYAIQVIPTQIFYDATGKERYRHEGFMAKKDILAKWKELGVELTPPASATKGWRHGGAFCFPN